MFRAACRNELDANDAELIDYLAQIHELVTRRLRAGNLATLWSEEQSSLDQERLCRRNPIPNTTHFRMR